MIYAAKSSSGPPAWAPLGEAPSIVFEEFGDGGPVRPGRLHVVDLTGAIHGFSRFNPLIYYSIYGDGSFYDVFAFHLPRLLDMVVTMEPLESHVIGPPARS